MARRIAVEDGLKNVEQELRSRGFQVTKFTNGTMTNVDGAVVTGMANNVMGIADTNGNKFPIVEANGLTAIEVADSLETRFSRLSDESDT
ncbi:MAG TPA: YkuS family protein [Symbiobacteriaceae bacterium]|nr:YkuS family protein [Symbiobacteriaceae bacterium]